MNVNVFSIDPLMRYSTLIAIKILNYIYKLDNLLDFTSIDSGHTLLQDFKIVTLFAETSQNARPVDGERH